MVATYTDWHMIKGAVALVRSPTRVSSSRRHRELPRLLPVISLTPVLRSPFPRCLSSRSTFPSKCISVWPRFLTGRSARWYRAFIGSGCFPPCQRSSIVDAKTSRDLHPVVCHIHFLSSCTYPKKMAFISQYDVQIHALGHSIIYIYISRVLPISCRNS